MSDNQTYYYMRLKDDFFNSEKIAILEGIPNEGYKYSNILLKLYLRSLKTNGKLMVDNRIPYNINMIASITGHTESVCRTALELFENLGIIDVLDNGAIYMLDIQEFIGKSSTEADRKREYRKRIESEKQLVLGSGQMSGQMSDKRTPEIRDKSIDIRDKSSENNNNNYISIPDLEEIDKYFSENNIDLDADRFYNYYQSRDWKIKGDPITDWKAAVNIWLMNKERLDG